MQMERGAKRSERKKATRSDSYRLPPLEEVHHVQGNPQIHSEPSEKAEAVCHVLVLCSVSIGFDVLRCSHCMTCDCFRT